MGFPTFMLECAFSTGPFAAPSWNDVTDFWMGGKFQSPQRAFELDLLDAGRSEILLDNADRSFEAENPTSVYAGEVLPLRRLRLSAPNEIAAAGGSITAAGTEITDVLRALRTDAGGAGLAVGQSCDQNSYPASTYGIWRAGTNLHRRGQCDATTDYVAKATGVTITRDTGTVPPFSAASIAVAVDGSTSNQGVQAQTATGLALAAGTSGAAGLWFKGTAGFPYQVDIQIANTDASATTGTAVAVTATGAWQYVVAPSVAVAVGKTGDRIRLRAYYVSGLPLPHTFNVAHPMIESAQTEVSPYVATSGGATSARAAARVQAPASLLDETRGWLALRVRWGSDSSQVSSDRYLFAWQDSGTTLLSGRLLASSLKFRMSRLNGGAGATVDSSSAISFSRGDTATIVFAWTSTTVKISVNGGAFDSVGNTDIPVLAAATFDLGSFAATLQLNGEIEWAAGGTGNLVNAGAAAIAALGENPRPWARVWPDSSTCTFTWSASTASYEVPATAYVAACYAEGWPPGWDRPEEQNVSVPGIDGFEALDRYSLIASYSQELSGARIGHVLDSIGFPAADRSLDAGQETITASTFAATDNKSALQHIRDVVATEGSTAAFFMDGRGRACFHDRQKRLKSPYTTSLYTFTGDSPSAAEIPCELINPQFSKDTIINDARVTPSGGTTQQYTDVTSQGEYMPRSRTASTLHIANAQALQAAAFMVSRYKEPILRFDAIEVMPLEDDDIWDAVFDLEIGDRITVVYTPAEHPDNGGGQVSLDCNIEGIALSFPTGEGKSCRVRYQLSPADLNAYWVAGDSVNSLAGVSTRPAY